MAIGIDKAKALAEAEEAARTERRRAHRAMRAAGHASWELNPQTRRLDADAAFWTLFGIDWLAPQPDYRTLIGATVASDRPTLMTALRQSLEHEEPVNCTIGVVLKGGGVRSLKLVGQRWRSADGSWRVVGLCSDVTEDVLAKAATELTLRELDHRVKNVFAVMLGVVTMTARTAKTPGAMAETLSGRLSALARAHSLLRPAVTATSGSPLPLTLAHLLDAVIEPLLPLGQSRVLADGPVLLIGPKAVTPLVMLFQELATIAIKHGALSSPSANLSIRWHLEDEWLRLVWSEEQQGWSPNPPQEAGFGSKLIDAVARIQLMGKLEKTMTPLGLRVEIALPLTSLTVGRSSITRSG